MNIVYCFNDNSDINDKEQIMLLTTSITSLLKNNNIDDLKIFIIYSYFNKINLDNFKKNFKLNLEKIYFIPFPEKYNINIDYMMEKSIKANKGTFLRLFIGELLPIEIKKVIYLDTDTIINKSLNELFYNSDFENKSLQVILDNNKLFSENKEIELNIKKGTYFNAGIIFINLDKIRNCLLKDSLEVCNKYNNLFADQDILNIAYNNSIKLISDKYNYIVNNKFSNNIAIYHYAAMGKILKIRPNLINNKYKKIFWEYFDETNFSGYRPKIKFFHIITYIIYNIIPKKILLILNKSNIYIKLMKSFSDFSLGIKK